MALFNLNFLKRSVKAKASASPQASYALDGYEAASYSRDRSQVFTPPADRMTNPAPYTRNEILRLSRFLVNNYPLAERILSATEIYAVGPGLVGNAVTADKVFNENATRAFDSWAANAFCSANNHYNLYEMQKLIAREYILAGEVFVVMVKSPVTSYPQLMLVSSEQVRHSGAADDNSVDGLFMDAFGKVTAYNIFTGAAFQKIDASNVIHLIRHKQIGQLRGIGGMAASLNSMRDVKDVMLLEKKAMKAHSMLTLAITKKGGDAGPGGLLGGGIPVDARGTPTAGQTNRRLENPFGGAAIILGEGEDIELLTSERTTENFARFCEMLTRDTCLNLSLPYEFLVNADKLTGTAVRFVLSDADAFFRSVQDALLDGTMIRIYGWVISSFINSGKLAAPAGGLLPWDCAWTRPLKSSVDTQRNSTSDIALLQNSLLSFEGYYSSRGKDWKAELRQRAAEEKFLNELAVETGVDINRLRALTAGAMPIPGEVPETETTPAKKAA